MKKILLAGAAVTAMLAGATAAQAQTSPIEVRIGGDAFFEAGFVSEDNDAGKKSGDFRDRYRLNIVVTGKASNTLSYGARMRLKADNGGAGNVIDADRGYMFIDSSYGNIRLGTGPSYNDDIGGVYRPIDYQFLAENDQISAWAGDSALMAHTLADNGLGTKVIYVTPSFSGLSAGLSFTPDSASVLNEVNTGRSKSAGGWEDAWEVGLNYNNKFGDLSVAASLGYMAADSGVSTLEDLAAWQAGLSVGYKGFTLAGGYILKDGDNAGFIGTTSRYKSDTTLYNVGASYAFGNAVVGVGYMYGEREGSTTTAANLEQSVWSLGGNYVLAPGLSVGAEYAYVDISGDPTSVADNKANVFLLRTFAAF